MKARRGVALAATLAAATLACSNAPDRERQHRVVPVSSIEASPLAECAADDRASQAGVVYDGTEVEGHLVVHPSDAEHLVAAWQQDRWNNGAARGVVVGVSDDGGRTWGDSTETKTSLCTGGTARNGGAYRRVTDPWVSIAPDGTAFLATLSVDPDAASPFGVNPDAILVGRSRDGGLTWDDPVTLVRDTDPVVYNDKPSITADPHRPGTVYAVWGTLMNDNDVISGVTTLSSSTDGGRTWEEPRTIYDPEGVASTLGTQLVVLPSGGAFNGELVAVATVVATDVDTRTYSFRVVATSSADGGATWSRSSTIAEPQPNEATDPLSEEVVVSGQLLADAAVDPRSGRIYVTWLDAARASSYNRVFLSSSPDAGRSWTKPVPVNLTPSDIPAPNRQVILPSVHVLPDGTVGVTYLDFRNNGSDRAGESLDTDAFLAHCRGAGCADGESWSERRITRASFDLRNAPMTQGAFVGDYVGLAGGGSDFLALLGIVDGRHEVTQYVARVSPND